MTATPDKPLKTIFPESSFAKRAAVKAVRLYAKTLPAPPPFPPPGDSPVKILIQSMGGIGNTLMATPLIAAARAQYPNGTIDVLTTPGAAELLRSDPAINTVITDQPGDDYSRIRYQSINSQIRKSRYDAALVTLNAVTFRFAVRSIWGRVPLRIIHDYGFLPQDDFTQGFTFRVGRDKSLHDAQNNLRLLSALTGCSHDTGPLAIELLPKEQEFANSYLLARGISRSDLVIGLCPGSSGWMSFKRWPLTHYIETCKTILKQFESAKVLLFTGPDEKDEAPVWKSAIESERLHRVEDISIREFSALLGRCNVVLANDSLPMHICAALRTPVVAFFGPTNPKNTGPWSPLSTVLTPNSPNHYFRIPYSPDPSQFEPQMEAITVSSAIEATTRLLGPIDIA